MTYHVGQKLKYMSKNGGHYATGTITRIERDKPDRLYFTVEDTNISHIKIGSETWVEDNDTVELLNTDKSKPNFQNVDFSKITSDLCRG
jgi:hypothetical protein